MNAVNLPRDQRMRPPIESVEQLRDFVAAIETMGRFANQEALDTALRYAKGRLLVAIAAGAIASWEAKEAARLVVTPEGCDSWSDFDARVADRLAQQKLDREELERPKPDAFEPERPF